MKFKAAYSIKETAQAAVADIKAQFSGIEARAILFFASARFDPDSLAADMKSAFPGAEILGCTTAGEIVSGKMLKQSVVAMAMSPEGISDIKIVPVENIGGGADVKSAFNAFESHFGEPAANMEFKKYVGMILVDGLSGAEEKLMDEIGDMTNVIFIGGSAGDDVKFERTHVFANGKAYTNAAVLALMKPVNGFNIIKTQSFKILDKKFIATKVNVEKREVLEFNGQPAAKVYAEAVGVPVDKAADKFMTNPVGLIIDDEPYVRSPQQIKGDSVIFYCNIVEGMELALLESTDIVQDTRNAVENKNKELGGIAALVDFHCILRTLELDAKGQSADYGKIFTDIPTIGFSTYGEEYIGHINQTSTMLVFK